MNKKSNRAFALLNASTVWSWASTFGHGSIIELTTWPTGVTLIVHLPYDSFDLGRELVKFKRIVSAGAKIEYEDRPHLQVNVLRIEWSFDTEY
jgi:hypothetical protein